MGKRETRYEIEASRKILKKIFDNIGSPIFLIDKNFLIERINKSAEKIFNVKEEEVLKTPCYRLCHSSSTPVDGCPLLAAINSKKSEEAIMEIKGKIFQIIVDPILDKKGDIAGAVHIMNNVTKEIKEKEKLKEQLALAQRIEAVGRLAGGVAHDFNNFLSVILGNLELAFSKIKSNNPLYQYLLEIQEAARKSSALTTQLLGFARKQTYRPQILNINEHLSEMKNIIKRFMGENVSVNFFLDKKILPAYLDPSQVDQVIMNLLINARDAIGIQKPGQIVIETKNVLIEENYSRTHIYAKQGQYVLLSITDNGCGISKENLSRIFEPFFTTKDKGKGTGLGLSTVYGIVHQNNGFINVYSEVNIGTTFKVYFPAYLEKDKSKKAEKKDIPSLFTSFKKIVVVEDEEAILRIIKPMLEQHGFEVYCFSKPLEAIQFIENAEEADFDILITDVIMPEMNGKELYKTIKNKLPHLKVLYMSGYTANVITLDGILDDDVFFIEKPFTSKQLLEKIKQLS